MAQRDQPSRLLRRIDSVVRARPVRSTESDSAADMDSRSPSRDEAGVAHLHRRVPRAPRAWEAFREPTPMALNKLRHGDTTPLPFLAAAVTRFLQEYPWTSDGLS